jgi:hypothetical protein
MRHGRRLSYIKTPGRAKAPPTLDPQLRSHLAAGACAKVSLLRARLRENGTPGTHAPSEATMDEDRFNMELRKFLKVVGVTSQREVENAVRKALAAGKIKDNAKLKAKVVLSLPAVGLSHEIDGEIALG